MSMTAEKNNGLCRLRIEGDMTIFTASELKSGLLKNLDDCTELEADLSQVTEMDTAGFQLLFLLKREAVLLNKGFRILAHSPATSAAVALFNMADYFGK